MKIDIDKLIKLNALASKHFHKKHTIILPPGEKINFNNALGIEYDKGNWKLEDGLQEYVEILQDMFRTFKISCSSYNAIV